MMKISFRMVVAPQTAIMFAAILLVLLLAL